jgi:hypothetical protein
LPASSRAGIGRQADCNQSKLKRAAVILSWVGAISVLYEQIPQPVHQIVRMLANGDTVEALLAEYPFLSREDIMASLDYAAGLAEEQITLIEVVNI